MTDELPDRASASAKKPGGKAPAIKRAVAILRLLGRQTHPMGVQAIARELGLVPSTCLYVLRALQEEGLVAIDEDTRRYRLDSGILTLARGWLQQNKFADIARPHLAKIAAQTGVSTMAVQLIRLDHIIVVASEQGAGDFQLSAPVGSRLPALISASGRCIAASSGQSDDWLRSRFDELRWDNPPGFDAWMEEVRAVRSHGYGVDDGSYMSGVTVVAAPVGVPGRVPEHVLVALGMSTRMRELGTAKLGEILKEAAQKLSAYSDGPRT